MTEKQIIQLDQATVDKIAAGEVVERPSSVAKELVENAIDAGASAITVEIKDGGTTFIRVTDNGEGIARDQLRNAFLSHSTSKIRTADDLLSVQSLGFRGEALSSIAAVAKVEVITKTKSAFVGSNYVIHGSKEVELIDIGAPEGTTIFVRQLFYNTPVRRKFLKSPMTEGNYIGELMEHLALSNPNVSFRLIANNAQKLQTSGNGSLKDAIFEIYGRQMAAECLPVDCETAHFHLHGFIGTPAINRGNRLYETFFVNDRYIKSRVLQRAVEDGYTGFLMQHQYPFVVLFLDFPDGTVDVNVHPTKQDVRFDDEKSVYDELSAQVREVLRNREDVAKVPLTKTPNPTARQAAGAEPFEESRLLRMKADIAAAIAEDSPYTRQYDYRAPASRTSDAVAEEVTSTYGDAVEQNEEPTSERQSFLSEEPTPERQDPFSEEEKPEQQSLFSKEEKSEQQSLFPKEAISEQQSFLSEEARPKHRIVGQVFDTYWIIEYNDAMYLIDQHAAHEKVLYERFMAALAKKEMTSQQLSPPVIVTLSDREEAAVQANMPSFERLGYAIESFGGREFAITAIPGNLYHIDAEQMFMEAVAMCTDLKGASAEDLVTERVASISCKAAVKGNNHLSLAEVEALIDELLTLDNPYHCPHGRPTIVSMTKYELDRKFKRIV